MPVSQNQNIKWKQYCNKFNPLKMVHIKQNKTKQLKKQKIGFSLTNVFLLALVKDMSLNLLRACSQNIAEKLLHKFT